MENMKDIIGQALGRVQALGLTLGLSIGDLAGTLARELQEMGYELVQAAKTGEVQGDDA